MAQQDPAAGAAGEDSWSRGESSSFLGRGNIPRPESPDSRCGVSAPETENLVKPESPDRKAGVSGPDAPKTSGKQSGHVCGQMSMVLGKIA